MSITATTGKLDVSRSIFARIVRGIITGVLCCALGACQYESYDARLGPLPPDSLDTIRKRGTLRVVSRVNPATFVLEAHGPAGIEYELAREFADYLGVGLEMIPAGNIGEVYAALDSGRADIAASGLSQRRFGGRAYLYSTSYFDVRQQVVFRHGNARPESLEDLVGARVMALAQSSSADALREAQRRFPALGWMEGTRIETFDLLRKVADGEIDYAIVKSNEFFMHHGLFPHLEIAFDLDETEQLSWVLAKDETNLTLYRAVETFLARHEKDGELDLLREQFFGYLPEINRKALKAFARRAEKHLPKFEKTMRRVAEEEGIDWHLLAAISYQESHWNPRAVSRTGVEGMMMLTRATAAEVGVEDRTDLEQSLRGGARYYRKLQELLPTEIPRPDRDFFALAAYNIGLGHVEDARKLAALRGDDPNRWPDVEKQLPLLTKREWYTRTRHGYARGFETVSFVRNVRQYHRFLAHRSQASDPFLLAALGNGRAVITSREKG
jgi:membrane-bound lytic murein transglycosylase F